jgi:hypothetical protein
MQFDSFEVTFLIYAKVFVIAHSYGPTYLNIYIMYYIRFGYVETTYRIILITGEEEENKI